MVASWRPVCGGWDLALRCDLFCESGWDFVGDTDLLFCCCVGCVLDNLIGDRDCCELVVVVVVVAVIAIVLGGCNFFFRVLFF